MTGAVLGPNPDRPLRRVLAERQEVVATPVFERLQVRELADHVAARLLRVEVEVVEPAVGVLLR